ncbi:MAG: hypothetical protein HC932_02805 [Thermales bacterium]|nr:hypothetical protein [Thermales bacterium]
MEESGFVFFLICFLIVWILRKFIVQPLGFYVNGTASSGFEIILLSFFVLGFFIYSINRLFPEYSMPAVIPGPILKLLGASQTEFFRSTEERNVWSVVPWLWYFGPIAVMYSMFINEKIHSSKDDSKD